MKGDSNNVRANEVSYLSPIFYYLHNLNTFSLELRVELRELFLMNHNLLLGFVFSLSFV